MKENIFKKIFKSLFFKNGSVKKIRFGPLRGKIYKVSSISGISGWYSGHETAMQNAFKKYVKTGDTVVDIGCNWGVHALFLSDLVGISGKVIAIEPSPAVASEAKWHFKNNNSTNVILNECAVSDHSGKMFFSTTELSTTGPIVDAADSYGAIEVPVTTLDEISNTLQLKKINLIKIDVEGHEYKALLGSKNVLQELRPIVIIELHTPEQDLLVSKFVRNLGYLIERIDGTKIENLDQPWPDPKGVWGCIICFPPKIKNL